MSDDTLSTTIAEADGAPDNSAVIDESGDHKPAPEHKPGSADDAISRAIDEAEAKEVKEPEPKEGKKEKPVKEEPKEDAEEAAPEGDDEDGDEDSKPEKPRLTKEEQDAKARQKQRDQALASAPKGFVSPTAKEKWANVPHEVRGEVNRVLKEAEELHQKAQENSQRYEAIRDFDELARSHGRDLRDSLLRVHQIETELQTNPIAGLNRVLMEAGPRKADGQPVSLFELAQFIVSKGPQGYQQMVAQSPQRQGQQSDSEVQQLRAEIAQMRQEQKLQEIEASIIEPFKRENPRYEELEGAIAQILKSGMIPDSVSGKERLAMAYDMAVRLNPASRIEPDEDDEPAATTNSNRAVSHFGGSRSIKGSPPTGADGAKPKRKVMSRDQAINAAMAALR